MKRAFTTAAVAISLAGCVSVGNDRIDTAPVSDVINAVKGDLNAYLATPPKVVPAKGTCYSGTGNVPLNLVPTKAAATLKTIASKKAEASVGLADPIGVIKLDPSYSGALSDSRTQTITILLDVSPSVKPQEIGKGAHPLGDALGHFRDELLKVDHTKTPCLKYGDKSTLKLSLAFDIVSTRTGGFALQLATVKVGDKETLANEAHQILEVEMELVGGALNPQ
jgi:hypothetical protein